MAAAVAETAAAVAARAEGEAAIRAENDALAAELVALRRAGRITALVPLGRIRTTKLLRDRQPGPDPELEMLVQSIRELGLSNPVLLEPDGQGGYELVQGWRRLAAFRRLAAETGEERWQAIPANLVAPGGGLPELYRRMVDENLVRKDVSFAEMAALALAWAADPAGPGDTDRAVSELYRSAGKQKRSYIRAFAELLELLDKDLAHARAIPRALGLALRRRLAAEPGALGALQAELASLGERSEAEELAVLAAHAGAEGARALAGARGPGAEEAGGPGAGGPGAEAAVARAGRGARARTSFRLPVATGEVRCTAADGRVELRLGRDFAAIERRRLEAAVAAFFRALDG
jgi:ParB family chromosome partitioning protein